MAAKGRTLALVAVLLLLYVASSYGAVTASMAARGAPLTGPCTEAKKKHAEECALYNDATEEMKEYIVPESPCFSEEGLNGGKQSCFVWDETHTTGEVKPCRCKNPSCNCRIPMSRITATATDVDTGDKLQGVQITVECGTKSRSSVTDGDGSASELGLFLNDSQCALTASLDGYFSVEMVHQLEEPVEISVDMKQIPVVAVHAKVLNATTNGALEGVAVTLVCGSETLNGVTGSDGTADFGDMLALTTCSVTATLDGYIEVNVHYTVPVENAGVVIGMSPLLAEGQLRAILNWGYQPEDLDLMDYSIQSDCLIKFSSKTCGVGTLDQDVMNGGLSGSETITWSARDSDVHLVYVKNYDYNSPPGFPGSGAAINFYGAGGGEHKIIQAPTSAVNDQRYWVVACFDGSVGFSSITEINTTSNSEPGPEVCG